MRLQLRKVEIADVAVPVTAHMKPEYARRADHLQKKRELRKGQVAQVALLPGEGGGQDISVTGYGAAPDVAPGMFSFH